jgi:hypothetical protein
VRYGKVEKTGVQGLRKRGYPLSGTKETWPFSTVQDTGKPIRQRDTFRRVVGNLDKVWGASAFDKRAEPSSIAIF